MLARLTAALSWLASNSRQDPGVRHRLPTGSVRFCHRPITSGSGACRAGGRSYRDCSPHAGGEEDNEDHVPYSPMSQEAVQEEVRHPYPKPYLCRT